MMRFEGKTVLVTGGTSGIGLATALAFANEGARLVITGRDQSTLDQAKAQLSSDSIAIRNDAAHSDTHMLAVLDGRERTEHEYRCLLDLAGLRLTRVIHI